MDSLETRRLLAVALPDGFAESLVAGGLTSPTSMAFAPDGRLFVALKGGDLRVIKNGSLLPTPFTTVDVDTFGERGLGGITFDPDFETNQFVYTYYTATSPTIHNRVSRFVANGDVAVPGSEQVLLDLPPPEHPSNAIHNGGSLQFGPEGALYIAVGEHGSSAGGWSMSHPFGKILRINSDGTIPSDNPFFNTTTGINRAIWATGLRNPFTTAFQPGTGRFYINDVGEDSFEEINLGVPGANYGWPVTEGEFNPITHPSLTNPTYTYPHPEGYAITGGVFYNPANAQFPSEFVGEYFFADYAIGFIRHMNPDTLQVSEFATGAGYPVDLDVSPDGALYYLSRATDSVYKITAAQAPAIVLQPQSQLVHNGDSVTFTAAASGQVPLSYQWQKNEQNIVGATTSSYMIQVVQPGDSGDVYRCIITNTHGQVTSDDATLTVTEDTPPAPVITSTGTFRGGQTINFAGAAIDLEDGLIPASNMTWEVILHHNTHVHPFVTEFSGVTGGSFVVPTVGHTEANIWFRVHLTVTDSAGFVRSTYKDILPQTSTITMQTNLPGLTTSLDGQPKASGTQVLGVRGMTRVLTAPQIQVINGTTYKFLNWSDGGASAHAITWPDSATTYTANYVAETIDYISDIDPSVVMGVPKRDTNVGGWGMTIDGVTYSKGIGLLGSWGATYDIDGRYDTFTARIGADDFVENNGTMKFQVFADGELVFESGLFTGATPGQDISVDVTGVDELKLVLDYNGDDFNGDWGNFADAKLHAAASLTPLPPSQAAATAPYYNRVVVSWSDRSSNEQGFELQRSSDGGTNYTTIATLGVGVTSYIDNGRSGGTLYKYRVRAQNGVGNSAFSAAATVTTPASTLPAGWSETDIGTMLPNDPGNTSFNSGTYTIRAGGIGIYSEADSFHFVYRMLVGDGEIVARVTDLGEGSPMRSGVMMRDSLAPGSREAFVYTINGFDSGMIWRPSTDSESSIAPIGVKPLPYWVKLTRQGSLIAGFTSADGVNWSLISMMNLNASSPLYVGLAATSWYAGFLNTVTYDNVSVTNAAPEVAIAASAQLNPQKTAATLGVLGSDDGAESGLTYTWSVLDKPLDADDPLFSINGTNASRNSVATFSDAGAYTLRVTISDGQHSVTSDVGIAVDPQLTAITVTPSNPVLVLPAPVQFNALAVDQFGDPVVPQPTFEWNVEGAGSISETGLYTPLGEGEFFITATAEALVGSATLIIDSGAPYVVPITSPAPAPGDATWTFNVTYADTNGVDVSTLGDDDIIVIAPDATQYPAVLLDYSPEGDGTPRLATYRIILNDLCFDSTDNGEWSVMLVSGSVKDTSGFGVPGGVIHNFSMEAPHTVVNQVGELIVNGTPDHDEISLDVNGEGDLIVTVNNVDVLVPSDVSTSIIVRTFGNDDTLNINGSLFQTVSYLSGGDDDVLNINEGVCYVEMDLGAITVNVNAGAMIGFYTSQHLAALNVTDATAFIGNSEVILVTDSLTLTGVGGLDLNSGALIVNGGDIGSWNGSAYTGLLGLIEYGRQGGSWAAQGITSSAAADSGGTNDLGIARAGDLLGLEASQTDVWRGETIRGDSIVIRYTWAGDADLNGQLNGDDYFYLDSNVLQSGSVFGFAAGDFNYDGALNGDDYFLLDSTILFAQLSGPL